MCPIVNLQLVVKCKKRIFHSSRVEVALLRYIVFYCKLGCDTSEPHMSYVSRACSSLVRQPYYAPNCIISKIRGLETIFVTKKGSLNGRIFYMDEYTLIFLFSQCIMWAFKWGVCRLVAQPRHAPKYGPIAQLGERSVRIREVKGSNPSRSTFSSSVILTLLLFFCVHISHTPALGPRGIRTARPCRRQGKQSAQWAVA